MCAVWGPSGKWAPKQVKLPKNFGRPIISGGSYAKATYAIYSNVTHQTSDQKRLPAEFKHITKRRRRN